MERYGIEILIDPVTGIDPHKKLVHTGRGREPAYSEKLSETIAHAKGGLCGCRRYCQPLHRQGAGRGATYVNSC